MPVVSNTSPILNLAVIDQLDQLRRQFGEVLIPEAVLSELGLDAHLPGTKAIQAALEAGWLRVVDSHSPALTRALTQELDCGEAAAIALALEIGAEPILIDERDGRAKAKHMGLRPVGLLGVLLKAKRLGQLESLQTAMQSLKRDAGFFIAEDLFVSLLREAGESL
jgi:predicted nucleic acid-binding protein